MDAQFTHFMGIGDQGSTGRNSFDLLQANLQAFVPVTHDVGVEAKAGMFVSPMGYEALDPRADVRLDVRLGPALLASTPFGESCPHYRAA